MYLILTENKNKPDIERLCMKYVSGYNILEGVGLWSSYNGQLEERTVSRENSLVILVHSHEYNKDIKPLAYAIKEYNKQERVDIINLKDKVHWV